MRAAFPLRLARGLSSSALLLFFASHSRGEPLPTESPQMAVAAHSVPPAFFQTTTRSPKEFFEMSGLEFPPGAEVTVDPKKNVLYMRNTPSNLALLDTLMIGLDCRWFSQILVDLQVFEFERPAPSDGSAPPKLSTADFLQLPVESRRLVDRITVISQSGVGATAASTRANSKALAKTSSAAEATDSGHPPPFSPSEFGVKAFSESTVGPDGQTIETNLNVRLRVPLGSAAADFFFPASFKSVDRSPVVVFSSPLGKEGKWLAVIAKHTLIEFSGKERPLFPDPATPPGH